MLILLKRVSMYFSALFVRASYIASCFLPLLMLLNMHVFFVEWINVSLCLFVFIYLYFGMY